jgi:hypothetical protein
LSVASHQRHTISFVGGAAGAWADLASAAAKYEERGEIAGERSADRVDQERRNGVPGKMDGESLLRDDVR